MTYPALLAGLGVSLRLNIKNRPPLHPVYRVLLNSKRKPLFNLQSYFPFINPLLTSREAGDGAFLLGKVAERLGVAAVEVLLRASRSVGERSDLEGTAEQRPEHREVGNVDGGRRLSDVPEHVDRGEWI